MTDIANLSVRVTTQGIKQARRELDDLARTSGTAERATRQQASTTDRLASSFNMLKGAVAALGLGAAVRSIVSATDTYRSLQGQLRLVTESQEQLNSTYQRALALSNATGASTESTVTLFTRLSRATEELNISQDSLFRVTETLNKAFVVSGATATEAAAATIQLSQGLAAGALRGEEFNSVNEQAPRIMSALATSLGVTRGELREMAMQGELTTEVVVGALMDQSAAIDGEFSKMPNTVGRAMQKLKNTFLDTFGSADADPITESIEGLVATMQSPGTKTAMNEFAAALLRIAGVAGEALVELTNLGQQIGANAAAITGNLTELDRMNQEIKDLDRAINGSWLSRPIKYLTKNREELEAMREALIGQRDRLQDMGQGAFQLEQRLEQLYEQLGNVEARFGDTAEEEEALRTQISALEQQLMSLGYEFSRTEGAVKTAAEAKRELKQEAEQVTESVGDMIDALIGTERAAGPTHDSIMMLVDSFEDTDTAAKDAKKAIKEAGDEMDGPFSEALGRTISRIDQAFAEAWRGAFDSFEDFADGLKRAFQNLLAELAHMAITKPIIVQVAGLLGGSAGAAAAGGTLSGAAGSAAGGMIGLGGAGLIGAGTSMFMGSLATTGANMMANPAVAQMMSNMGLGNAMGAQILGGVTSLGAGIAGGWAGTQLGESLFGRSANSSWGATAGGIAGTILGAGNPIGTLIGSAIGGVLDAAFGSSNSDKWVNYQFSGGQAMLTRDTGKPLSQDAAEAGVGIVQSISDALGGSNASFEISGGRRSGLRLAGQVFGDDAEGFAREAFDLLIAGADQFSQAVRDMALAFDGSAQDAVDFTLAWAGIEDMLGSNVVEQAGRDFADLQDAMTNPSAFSSVESMVDRLRELSANYDGSASAAQGLAQGLMVTKQSLYEMAIATAMLGEELNRAAGESATRIREAGMTDAERSASWLSERDRLVSELATMSDPEQINTAVARILELNERLFFALSPEQQAAQAGNYAAFAESVGEMAAAAIERAMERIAALEEEANATVESVMQTAANTQYDASVIFANAVQEFVAAAGIDMSIGPMRAEVNA